MNHMTQKIFSFQNWKDWDWNRFGLAQSEVQRQESQLLLIFFLRFLWFSLADSWERLLKQALSLTMEEPTLNTISSAAFQFLPKWCDCCDSLKIRNSLFISFIACCQLRGRVSKWKRTDLECCPPLSCTMRFSSLRILCTLIVQEV